jgi:hypothetical protein
MLNRHRSENNIKICLINFQDIFQCWPLFDTVINVVCRIISLNLSVIFDKSKFTDLLLYSMQSECLVLIRF